MLSQLMLSHLQPPRASTGRNFARRRVALLSKFLKPLFSRFRLQISCFPSSFFCFRTFEFCCYQELEALEKQMEREMKASNFEECIRLREQIKKLKLKAIFARHGSSTSPRHGSSTHASSRSRTRLERKK